MPTGTGKTGVIAGAVGLLPQVEGHRLVLTPWVGLRDQLIRDLNGRFWQRSGVPAPKLVAKRLPTSTRLRNGFSETEPTTYVGTIAAIETLVRRSGDLEVDVKQLFDGFGFVLVDEGHYEPAQHWSDAIRSLGLPTILLTATPYRNDHKFFSLSKDHRYRLPHHVAEDKSFLRIPDFELVTEESAERFVDRVIASVEERFPEETRVIVRCDTAAEIRTVVSCLEARGKSVVGVHERFDETDTLKRGVPNPSDHEVQYWVHQYKLMEGLDDPRFRVLALYRPLRNDRSLIQQIGRILRNPDRTNGDSALVIDNIHPAAARAWKAYRQFDEQDDPESVASLPQLVGEILAAQPEAFYYDGSYRTSIDLSDPHAWESFVFPLRTRIYTSDGDWPNLDDLVAEIIEEWEADDRSVFAVQQPDATTRVIPYVTAGNTRWLRRATFIEPRFGYLAIRDAAPFMFVSDTGGGSPATVDDHLRVLDHQALQGLFPKDSVLTSVALLNTDIGRHSARSRQVTAAAVQDLAPDLTDHAYVCSRATGSVGSTSVRRYVGLNRARVSDYAVAGGTFEDFRDWLDNLEVQLSSQPKPTATFERFATLADVPEDPAPLHVLLDIDQTRFEAKQGQKTVPLSLSDTAYEVKDSQFDIVMTGPEGKRFVAELKWSGDDRRYQLDSEELREERFHEDGDESRELVEVLNRDQSLRVVPKTRTVVYSHGHFFKPLLPSRRQGAFDLLNVLQPESMLADVVEEKGAPTDGRWPVTSVFGVIDSLNPQAGAVQPQTMTSVLSDPDLLLCTDMGTEIADFVATQDNRVVFMHAKAERDTTYYSASALHVIASQAIKNLVYLQPSSQETPRHSGWGQPWRLSADSPSVPRNRIGTETDPKILWRTIRALIADPQAEREVWLVLGNSLSKKALREQSRKNKPTPEALQALTILHATWVAVSQTGARLRVFCSP